MISTNSIGDGQLAVGWYFLCRVTRIFAPTWFWTIMLSSTRHSSYLQKFPLELISAGSYRGVGSQRFPDWNSALWQVPMLYPAWHLNTLWTGAVALGQLTFKGSNTKSEHVAQLPCMGENWCNTMTKDRKKKRCTEQKLFHWILCGSVCLQTNLISMKERSIIEIKNYKSERKKKDREDDLQSSCKILDQPP